ncbi:hypothetical protein F4810DRAFT_694592 [Camillea tinctor]|nr:hypothetical protein F4810DRAFT_694592 [Camillea tinctor]
MTTTTLSIPTSCLTEIWITQADTSGANTGLVLGNPDDPDCWPGTRSLSTTFSPALCPYGYTSACDATPARAGETAWACCPSFFSCDGGAWSCLSGRTESSTVPYDATMIDRVGNTITTTFLGTEGVNAHSIRVAFQSSDLVIAGATPTAPTTATSTPTPGIAPPLSPGATAGLGVGVGVGTFALLSLAAWTALGVRRRRIRERGNAQIQNAQMHQEVYREEMDAPSGLHELNTKPKAASELPDNQLVGGEIRRPGW